MPIKKIHNHHPFARPLNMRYFGNPKDPVFRKLPFKVRFAWRLRIWAASLDPGFTVKIEGTIPPPLDGTDFLNALHYGMVATQNYMAEEAQERSVALADDNKPA